MSGAPVIRWVFEKSFTRCSVPDNQEGYPITLLAGVKFLALALSTSEWQAPQCA
jgi:hypothetical protein